MIRPEIRVTFGDLLNSVSYTVCYMLMFLQIIGLLLLKETLQMPC